MLAEVQQRHTVCGCKTSEHTSVRDFSLMVAVCMVLWLSASCYVCAFLCGMGPQYWRPGVLMASPTTAA